MLKLDIDKYKYENQHNSDYKVVYKAYDSESLKPIDLKGVDRRSCYSNYFRGSGCNKNKIATQIESPTGRDVSLTMEEIKSWIDLSIENGMLPSYVADNIEMEFIENPDRPHILSKMVLDTKGWYQILIYIYLNTFRQTREDPGFIKAILQMCNEKGVDFYMAYVLSSHLNIVGVGHHCIEITKNNLYGGWNGPGPGNGKEELNLKAVRGLYRMLHDPEVNKGEIIGTNAVTWKCASKIKNLVRSNLNVPIKYLNDPAVVAIAHEFNEEKAVELHKEFIEKIRDN